MIYNTKDQYDNIQDIKVTERMTYLGIEITNKNKHFKEHKNKCINKGRKLANNIYSIVTRCSNRILIGKTYWKGLALSNILYGTEVIKINEEELKTLQRIDNQVYRAILQVPSYTAVEGLRAEIGASSCKARDIKNKIMYTKHAISNDNELVKEIFLDIYYSNKKSELIDQIKQYMRIININLEKIETTNEVKLKEIINKWDLGEWKKQIKEKSTLKTYQEYKQEIKEIRWYDNTESSTLMVKARLNALDLRWRKRYQNEETKCPLCDYEIETLEHFLLFCNAYAEIRQKYIFTQQPYQEDINKHITEILLFSQNDNQIEKKNYLKTIWKIRAKKIKELEQ